MKCTNIRRYNTMVEKTKIPNEYVEGGEVEKMVLTGIDEIQYLRVSPKTAIKKHDHDDQWEVWISIAHKFAYICLKGEEHECINNSDKDLNLMAIKGHKNYTLVDLTVILNNWGLHVYRGSILIDSQ